MESVLDIFRQAFGRSAQTPRSRFAVSSLTGAADAFAAAAFASPASGASRCVLAVTDGIPAAERLVSDLQTICAESPASGVRVLEFPVSVPGDKASSSARLRVVAALGAWGMNPYPLIVVSPSMALSQPVAHAAKKSLRLCAGATFPQVSGTLADFGYERVQTVCDEGEWSVRGGILDVWPPGEEFPVRAEFFGDELEGLRLFDASTQRSIEKTDEVEIVPVEDGDGISRSMLAELFPDEAVLLAYGHNEYDAAPFARDSFTQVFFGDPAPDGAETIDFPLSSLPGFGELDAKDAHHPELFGAAKARLESYLEAASSKGVKVVPAEGLSRGFEVPSGAWGKGVIVVAKSDRTFAKARLRRSRGSARGREVLDGFANIEPGEYVVHRDYGVGRYIGSSEIMIDGARREVFTIEYDKGAKLRIPASQAFKITRYVGVHGKEVKLHGIDGKGWTKDRDAAKESIADLARALLEVQAKRSAVPGYSYNVDCDGYDAFKAAFPYEETPDQLSAIADVEKDMSSDRPMDRLVCGDAGYGKTEVAMRAAYIAAMNGRQTAVLAPTTVLAEQHFETFTSRFDGTPVRIEPMSGFQSWRTHKGTRERLASGVCDIVIGTHALLSPRIRFRDLGLVIIDEEQRFGVRHKEFLKKMRATADVLTLSATPIPRTLYMSMTGMRDLSILRSPPRERVVVETSAVRDSDETVRKAIECELERGGQVFFLHNRVATIGRIEKRLSALCPSARITVAHGRMEPRELAVKMMEFERGGSDILLSTTIVESGIDIPRANTIIVDRADMFGLSDLYQLRGRVGRSSKQGRAYFLLPPAGPVTADARERLDALKRNGGLGGGFDLAVRDLELRGAGDLLGAKQSGHMAAIGFGLYCQLLKRAISLLKGEKATMIVDVKLNLDFVDFSPTSSGDSVASLPYSYIEDDASRMFFMKKIAEASTPQEVKSVEGEMLDRFGKLPAEAVRLLSLARLKIVCAKSSLSSLDVRGVRAVFRDGKGGVAGVFDLDDKKPDAKIAHLASFARSLGRRDPAVS